MGAVNPLPQWQYFNSTIEKQFSYEHDPLLHPPSKCLWGLEHHLWMYPASEILYHLNFLHSSHSVYLYIHVCIVYRELIISARKVMSYTHNHSWNNMPFQTTLHKSYLLCHYFSLFWFWLGHCWGLQTCIESVKSPFSSWEPCPRWIENGRIGACHVTDNSDLVLSSRTEHDV